MARERRTKIVVTLGPATDGAERVRALIEAGMDVARLNMSHGTQEEHARRLATVRAEAERAGRPVGVLLDLQGPKMRTGPLAGGGPVELVEGRPFVITTRPLEGTAEGVSTTYAHLARDVSPGDRILLSDGLIELRVTRTTEMEVHGEVVHGGALREHQGINLPGVEISSPSVTDKDLADLEFGLAQGVDYVAISFVRRAEDVVRVKERVRAAGAAVPVITKLEKPEALEHLEAIVAASDGVMVARGDLGVEMPPEQVPWAQKEIIRAANRAAIPVITATQMLESMIANPRPTRAEVSDVANAILDGSDAVMLSGETAIGKFPVAAVEMMARIARAIDASATRRAPAEEVPAWIFAEAQSIPQAIGAAVAAIGRTLPVAALCVVTRTGSSARMVSHYRPEVPILAFTPLPETYRRLSLLWGVEAVQTRFADSEEEYYAQVEHLLRERGDAKEGDTVVVTGGHPIAGGGPTNFIKILVLSPPPR
jgi:pyruvate kinase